VNNYLSTFALSFDPNSAPNIPFILYNIAVLFIAVAIFYTAYPCEANTSFQIFAPNSEHVLIRMSANKEGKTW
jgi:hypothetical protein